jgi:hypothetical protein
MNLPDRVRRKVRRPAAPDQCDDAARVSDRWNRQKSHARYSGLGVLRRPHGRRSEPPGNIGRRTGSGTSCAGEGARFAARGWKTTTNPMRWASASACRWCAKRSCMPPGRFRGLPADEESGDPRLIRPRLGRYCTGVRGPAARVGLCSLPITID